MKKILLISSMLFIFSCAHNATEEYKQIINNINTQRVSISNLNLQNAVPLTLESKHKGKIEKDDNIISITGMLPSNYDLYSFNINKPININIDISSYCDCLGFDKNLFNPYVILIDLDRRTINLKQKLLKNNNAYIQKSFSTYLNKPGKYYLLVLSNNKNLKERIASINTYSYAAGIDVLMEGIPIYSSPYGKYKILIKSLN